MSQWLNEKTIRIAEYFCTYYEKSTLYLYQDGSTFFEDDPKRQPYAKLKEERKRTVNRRRIRWHITNGFEDLEPVKEWPGKWIPVIRVVGNEYEVEGRIYLSGIVRNAKDAQRMYNYWTSQEAEMLALAPKAPFIGYGGQFEGYEHQWKTANTTNWPYLEANPDVTDHQGTPLPLPQRALPPMPQAGLIQAKMGAADDIKSTTGQYDASLGAEANEKSGKAILARERQTDTGTYHFVDNLGRAVRLRTRMIVDLIPKVYDTRRIARIIGLDGETSHVTLDPSMDQATAEVRDQNGALVERIYNPSVGKYDVAVTTGPSYMTKRQETADRMVELSQGVTDPTVALVMRYFTVKNLDFPDAQEFAGVLKRLAPPGLLDKEDGDSPEVAQYKQQLEQMGQQMEQMQGLMQEMANSVEAQEQARENFRAEIEQYKAETDRLQAVMPAAQALSPQDVAMIVMDTLSQLSQSPPLEMEEQQMMEGQEMHQMPSGEMMAGPPMDQMPMDNMPPMGGFMPEGQ